jgi:hypothetical protein
VAYLGSKCVICGYCKSLAAFNVHHPDSLTKDFTISTRTSWKVVERELRKCVLLCSNCHREVHEGMHPGFLAQPEDWRDTSWEDEPEPVQLLLL